MAFFSIRLDEFWLVIWRSRPSARPHYLLLRPRNLVRFEKVELDDGVSDQQAAPHHPPDSNVLWKRFGDCVPAELEADQELRHDNGDHHPGLAAELLARRVVKKLECFAEAYSSPQKDEEKTNWIEDVFWWNPQNKF